MTEGIVKVRNLGKKYILVEGEDGSQYSVNTRQVAGVHVGDKVSFDPDPDESRGKKARNLKKADYA
ncbi:MAG: hypothetical protein COT14_03595 [Candidatus Diapherotrites archaeon CG08_land_8_20_14_0_20_30_16]|nr:MAG: hypothetical protein COT14_03595 [Candidatus Diapherotrites archaeon CG08_land_8_20_14_0_20_30_16]